jgi:hypothetical protein
MEKRSGRWVSKVAKWFMGEGGREREREEERKRGRDDKLTC